MREFLIISSGIILLIYFVLNLVFGLVALTASIDAQHPSTVCNLKAKYVFPGISVGCYMASPIKDN